MYTELEKMRQWELERQEANKDAPIIRREKLVASGTFDEHGRRTRTAGSLKINDLGAKLRRNNAPGDVDGNSVVTLAGPSAGGSVEVASEEKSATDAMSVQQLEEWKGEYPEVKKPRQ